MHDTPTPVEPRKSIPGHGGGPLRGLLRARITAGLIVVLPIWVTVLLVSFVFRLMRDSSLWVVEGLLSGSIGAPLLQQWGVAPGDLRARGLEALPVGIQWCVGIFAVLLTIGLLYTVGLIASHFVGRRLIAAGEVLVDRVPIVKTIYRACKQVLEAFTGEAAASFQRVCLVPFPTKRVWSVGFITGVTHDRNTGEELCSVFIATTPNPTTGFVFVLRRRDLIELDWTVEDAVKVVMSGGVILPKDVPFRRPPGVGLRTAPVPV